MTTYHAIIRTMERTGLDRTAAVQFIGKAMERGKGTEFFNGEVRRYLESKSADGQRAIVYGFYCFIISAEDICITMYSISDRLNDKKHYDGKQKIRDIRKYMRFNSDYQQQEVCEYGTWKAS